MKYLEMLRKAAEGDYPCLIIKDMLNEIAFNSDKSPEELFAHHANRASRELEEIKTYNAG